MEFSVNLVKEGARGTIYMSGAIDEDSAFPKIDLTGVELDIYVDLADVTHVNSVGIRSWLNWFRPLASRYRFIFRNCPRPVVVQMNMVEGFLPPKSRVESFYVPFYCEECDRVVMVPFQTDKDVHYTAEEGVIVKIPETIKCQGLGCKPILDVHRDKYFKFLSLIR